jgi:hypothetical protein
MASIGFSKLSQWVSEYRDCFAIRNSESSKYIVTFAIQLFTAQEKIIFLNMFRQQCI